MLRTSAAIVVVEYAVNRGHSCITNKLCEFEFHDVLQCVRLHYSLAMRRHILWYSGILGACYAAI